MKFTLIILTLCIFELRLTGQKADLEFIYSAVESRFNLELDTLDLCDDLYVLNGISYSKEDFEHELRKYKKSDIKFTGIADISNTTFFNRNCDYIILIGVGEYDQSKESKKKELDSIRENLNKNLPVLKIIDYICKNCKQLIVDGKPIEVFEAQSFLNQLKPQNIDFIISYESANPRIYGRNAINGLTEIFLKKKRANKH